MSIFGRAWRLIMGVGLSIMIMGQASSEPEGKSVSIEMEGARTEILRLRQERAHLRANIDAPREELLADTTGYISIFAVYRVGSDGSRDMDTFLYIDGEVGDDTRDPITAGLSARLDWDLDGYDYRNGIIPAEDSFFADYGALENERLSDQVYTAYIDFNRVGPLDKLRLGRQYHDGFTGGHFDGVQARLQPGEMTKIRVYGGIPVNFYRLTGESPYSSDRIYGGAITQSLLDDLMVTVEVQGVREQRKSYGTRQDYQAVIALRYNIMENFRASVIESLVSGNQRDLKGTLTYWNLEHDLNLAFDYVWMSEHLRELAFQYTSYTDIMGTFEPYQVFRLTGSKGLGDHLEVGGEVTWRELTDSTDESLFNQEYTRTQASITVYDLPIDDLTATVHYEYWNASDDDTLTVGGDLRQRLGWDHLLEAGTYYSKFKYREYSLIDTVNVQTYFFRWRWALAKNLGFQVKGEVETTEDDTYNTVIVGITLNF